MTTPPKSKLIKKQREGREPGILDSLLLPCDRATSYSRKMNSMEINLLFVYVRRLLPILICIPMGFIIGTVVRQIHEVRINSFSYNESFDLRNMSKVYVSPNPCKTAEIAQQLVKGQSNFSFQFSLENETTIKTKYLLVLAVGIQQKDLVNKIVSKFSEDFAIMLFHYDGKASEWDQFEWSHRAIHITGLRQTKWWFAKRFLHPNVVAEYDYIFIWDEDLGVDNFNSEEYIRLVKKHDLEISQPAITSTRVPIYMITVKRNYVEVHKNANETSCAIDSPLLPPCAGFVEIMAPVFSRKAWNCVWDMIQNDLVHGWGLDFAFWRCVKTPHVNIGVVDAQWIEHLVLPTLGGQAESKMTNKTRQRSQVRKRSTSEWEEFERRMEEAEQQQHQKQKL